ncbi:MAG TPA: TlyA family RNA methyltransferase [Candidatus Sulfotelmatobacter sp.]|nr:TlyA family RNA methyltransferase [Candidatus Sulfotelmatobacter sp.]
MARIRIDQALVMHGMVKSRSQADSYIKLGMVELSDKVIKKSGQFIDESQIENLKITTEKQYVSRAALKLESVIDKFNLNFKGKTVLDVGSSTGGFTQLALLNGAKKVIAVEKGVDQMESSLRHDPKISLHEKTDIVNFSYSDPIDIVVIDVSFVSLKDILPSIYALVDGKTEVVAMVKPQFEATSSGLKHKGVIKNEKMRRDIFKEFEAWVSKKFFILNKADSAVSGAKGNTERFYLLRKVDLTV